mgnify:CR=1 FL=1
MNRLASEMRILEEAKAKERDAEVQKEYDRLLALAKKEYKKRWQYTLFGGLGVFIVSELGVSAISYLENRLFLRITNKSVSIRKIFSRVEKPIRFCSKVSRRVLGGVAIVGFLAAGSGVFSCIKMPTVDRTEAQQQVDKKNPQLIPTLLDQLSNEALMEYLTGISGSKNNAKFLLRAWHGGMKTQDIIDTWIAKESQRDRIERGLEYQAYLSKFEGHYFEVLDLAYGPDIASMILQLQWTGLLSEEEILGLMNDVLPEVDRVLELATDPKSSFFKNNFWQKDLEDLVLGG